MDEINAWLITGGLAVGAVFGFLVQRYRFCLVAGTSNLLLIKDYRQALAFAAAILVAVMGTQLLEMTQTVAIADSVYRDRTLDWFGAAAGGTVFGIGATLAGGCAARTLVKTMEGSVHSLIALVSFTVAATVTQFGFLEPLRTGLTRLTSVQLNTDAGIASILSMPSWLVLVIVAVCLLLFVHRGWQRSPDRSMLIVGAVIGALVVTGWVVTGVLARHDFASELMPVRPSSITVAGPLARFGYAITFGRMPALTFSVSFVAGMAAASLLISLVTRRFRITAPAKGMIKMALVGGALMGCGSILAYGCNVGQGLSGLSTLSLESVIAVIGMVAGIGLVVSWMERNA